MNDKTSLYDAEIESERMSALNSNNISKNDFVVYWMQQSQRTHFNHALEYAIRKANELQKPLLVFFGITDQFPEANLRHYHFMIQGLKVIDKNLKKRNIKFIVSIEHPVDGITKLAKNACLIIVDRGYLHIQKQWRKKVSEKIECPLIQIESDVIVPVETASEKEEYAAYTFRPKIHNHLNKFLTHLEEVAIKQSSLDFDFKTLDFSTSEKIITQLDLDSTVSPVSSFIGGEDEAKKRLEYFLTHNISSYEEKRNEPSLKVTSQLSPYLHFGHISPVYIALEVKKRAEKYADVFLEELIVRRELSMNFVHHNQSYDSLSCLPEWALETLQEHESDKRDYLYSKEELERASTHDPYWNAAQKELRIRGKMHGYMRMYWGKKIIEWTESPSQAFELSLYLNNKYELDGRDPNGFAGVAWCFGKHDRAWMERPIFGKIRYMNSRGLEHKINIKDYVAYMERMHWSIK